MRMVVLLVEAAEANVAAATGRSGVTRLLLGERGAGVRGVVRYWRGGGRAQKGGPVSVVGAVVVRVATRRTESHRAMDARHRRHLLGEQSLISRHVPATGCAAPSAGPPTVSF